MSQASIHISDWTQPSERVADIAVFDAEDCGGTERVTMAIYGGPTTTHLRMTLAEVEQLVSALQQKADAAEGTHGAALEVAA